MRIAVISDIHGNSVALDAALADIKGSSLDKIVCLGDTIQGGAQPNETIDRLRSMSCPTVMGNADAWLLGGEADSAEPTSKEQRDVRTWTLSRLSDEDITFLRSFQPTVEISLGETDRLLCFHGSPSSFNDVLLPETPDADWNQMLGRYAPAIMAGGHTHTQLVRRIGEGLYFNPGSIGRAYDYHLPKDSFHAESWAEYAILTHESRRFGLEFRRVHYDPDEVIQAIRSSGRPHANHMIREYERPRQSPSSDPIHQ